MDLAQLRSFHAVVRHGSFTLAARDLQLSQPAVSRHVQGLERELGVALFVRSRDGTVLTPEGERFYLYAEDVLEQYRDLLEDLRGSTATLEGELRIAASTTPAEFVVPRLVADFTTTHRNVKPIVLTADSQMVVQELLARESDLGFTGARMDGHGLRYDSVAEDEVVLAVPRHHPFARRREVPLEVLADQRFIEREDGSGTILSVRRALDERGLALPHYRVVMTLSTTHAIVSAVAAGYGIGFVSSLALDPRAPNSPVAVRLAGIPLRRSLYLVHDGRRLLPPVAQRFAEFVLARVKRSED